MNGLRFTPTLYLKARVAGVALVGRVGKAGAKPGISTAVAPSVLELRLQSCLAFCYSYPV